MSVIYESGPFRLDASLGMLMRGSQPVGIGHRAVALLRLLLDRASQPVAKEMLIKVAWSDLAVEDNNLTIQIAAIRKFWKKWVAQRGLRRCRAGATGMSARQS